jgi:hypothetical protein
MGQAGWVGLASDFRHFLPLLDLIDPFDPYSYFYIFQTKNSFHFSCTNIFSMGLGQQVKHTHARNSPHRFAQAGHGEGRAMTRRTLNCQCSFGASPIPDCTRGTN